MSYDKWKQKLLSDLSLKDQYQKDLNDLRQNKPLEPLDLDDEEGRENLPMNKTNLQNQFSAALDTALNNTHVAECIDAIYDAMSILRDDTHAITNDIALLTPIFDSIDIERSIDNNVETITLKIKRG